MGLILEFSTDTVLVRQETERPAPPFVVAEPWFVQQTLDFFFTHAGGDHNPMWDSFGYKATFCAKVIELDANTSGFLGLTLKDVTALSRNGLPA